MSHSKTDGTKNSHVPRSDPDQQFYAGDRVVYPAHGIGRVEKVSSEEIAGMTLEIIQISIDDTSLTVRVPVAKIGSTGLRKAASPSLIKQAIAILDGKPRMSKVMWTRRAQDYEQKIKSGDLMLLAEVVRDLRRNASLSTESSFSERQIFERALDRLAAEVAAVEGVEKVEVTERLSAKLRALHGAKPVVPAAAEAAE